MDLRLGFTIYILFSIMLVVWVFGTPVLALLGYDTLAGSLYNAAKPLCHQWIYRSQCIFNTSTGFRFDDCIPQGVSGWQEVHIQTRYTYASKYWDGEFYYSRDQVGLNRAEYVLRDGMEGYKTAMCSRDTFMYVGLLVAGVVYVFTKSKIKQLPSFLFLFISLVPMGIDGTAQLLGFWESTNLIRSITGLIAGIGVGYYMVFLLCDILDRKRTR